MFTFPLLLTIYAGFSHAFEADHLLAVSNIVSQRNSTRSSMKDGVFWGLGHASTICAIGILVIIFKVGISVQYFHYFEALVGCMLITLAALRLVKFFRAKKLVAHAHPHQHTQTSHQHLHLHIGRTHPHQHSLAYSVGLVHGLAGSGALILVVLAQIKGPVEGVLYLLIFGSGCIAGMLTAASLFSIPFSKKIMQAQLLQGMLIITSSALCLLYGGKVIYQNLIA